MDSLWRIEMLGWLRLVGAERVITRFRTQKVGALLAYLAYHSHRSHPREELAELLWPESYPETSRKNLRTALNSLRRQLEPPDIPPGAVLVADRASVRLNPDVCVTDVALFEAALQAAARAADPAARAQQFVAAMEWYRGELLPGYFDEWIVPERQRLSEAHGKALGEMVAHCETAGDLHGALQWARRLVGADPLREEGHQNLIRLLSAAGQPEAALRQYRDLERLLRVELRAAPEAALRTLARELEEQAAAAHPVLMPPSEAEAPAAQRPGWSAPVNPAPLGTPSTTTAAGREWSARGYLPPQFTRFFGREAEIARLRTLLWGTGGRGDETSDKGTEAGASAFDLIGSPCPPVLPSPRLVTLTGPGGTGKTRLAVEAAAGVRERFAGRVYFVRLMDLAEPELIAGQILDVLRVPRSPGVPPFEQVIAVLSADASLHEGRRGTLLVLDNLEHLLPEGADLVQALLERVATLSLWVTSRRSLGLPGEHEFPVAPLAVPRTGQRVPGQGSERVSSDALNPDPSTLTQFPSIRLFLDRAQAVRADFQLTPANAMAVARLCAGLEGIPLAIELAAARIGVLTPAQMLTRLEERFVLLTTHRRMADRRHQSLWVALDWSYQLLSPELQRFFACLSVFRGGWTLEAAEEVCEEPECPRSGRTLEYLERLRECSLVLAEERPEGMRYRLLETLREFGRGRLEASGEAEEIRRRHALYFLERAEADGRNEWRATEHDNLRAALDWAVEQGEAEIGLRLGDAVWVFWIQQGHVTEGRHRLSALLALSGASARTTLRAKVLLGNSCLAWNQGDYAAARLLVDESVEIHRELGDPLGTAFSQRFLGMLVQSQGDYETARSLYKECLRVHREAGDQEGVGAFLTHLGSVAYELGDEATALPLCEEGLRLLRQLVAEGSPCNSHYLADALDQLGVVTNSLDGAEAARALCSEGLAVRQEMGDRPCMGITLYNLGKVAEAASDYKAARASYGESLALRREMGDRRCIAQCLQGFARVAGATGRSETAVRLFGAAAALREALGIPLPPVEQVTDEPRVAALKTELRAEVFAEAWAQGAAMTLEQAMSFALEEGESASAGQGHPSPAS